MKKTIVLGATSNPSRYAYIAAHKIKESGHKMIPVGIRHGEVAGETILDLRLRPTITNADTITLYIGPGNQAEWLDYIISLKTKRIIFNPGTENSDLEDLARSQGIETVHNCTLVMLSLGIY